MSIGDAADIAAALKHEKEWKERRESRRVTPTREDLPTTRLIKARYPSTCKMCSHAIPAGNRVIWTRSDGVRCEDCATTWLEQHKPTTPRKHRRRRKPQHIRQARANRELGRIT